MKILMVTPEYPPNCGGIGWYVYYLSRVLASQGYNITVMLRSSTNSISYEEAKIKTINAGLFPLLNASKMVKKTELFLRSTPHDVCIVHSTPIGSWIQSIPTILVSHCCIAEAQKKLYRKAYDLNSLAHIVFKKLYIAVEKKSVTYSNYIAVVSKAMKKEIRSHYNRNAIYVGNAIDKEVFYPSESCNERGVLLPSMLKSGKGISIAVKVINRIRNSNCDIPFTFIGSGPMKKWLANEIRTKNLQNVNILEPLDHSKIVDLYRESSIVFLPSFYEGLPTVVLEALSTEIPVVATNVGGIPEVVLHGKTGFIHSTTDVEGMTDSILKLDKDSKLRRTFGTNGRELIHKNFNWKVVSKRFENIMESII